MKKNLELVTDCSDVGVFVRTSSVIRVEGVGMVGMDGATGTIFVTIGETGSSVEMETGIVLS